MQIESCEFPERISYDIDNNVWISLDEHKIARLGITSVHSAMAGKLTQVKLKPIGSPLQRGQSIGTIESVTYFGAVRTPLTGRLVASNQELERNPKLANDYPYDAGWFALIEPTQLSTEEQLLTDPKSSQEKIREMIHELRVHCFKAFPDKEMWEIGVECTAVLVRLNDLMDQSVRNTVVHVVSDDPTADIEMERWADETGQAILESRREGSLMHFIVRKVK